MIDLRKRLFSMLGRNQNLKKIDIVKHFALEGFKRSTIYNIIKRYESGLPLSKKNPYSWKPIPARKPSRKPFWVSERVSGLGKRS
jgi:hypothetical protein